MGTNIRRRLELFRPAAVDVSLQRGAAEEAYYRTQHQGVFGYHRSQYYTITLLHSGAVRPFGFRLLVYREVARAQSILCYIV